MAEKKNDLSKYDIPYSLVPSLSGAPGALDEIDVSHIRRKFLEQPYAFDSVSQVLDLYLPDEGDGPFPTLIYVHGGAFLYGDKNDIQFLQAIDGVRHGYAVASIGYRLAGEAQFPLPLFDVKAAIRFLRAHAERYHLDGDRFALCGDSAGAYYSVMAAATQFNPAFEDLSMGNGSYSSAVKCVISWFGCFDALRLAREEDDPDAAMDFYPSLVGTHPHHIASMMYFTDPINFITPAMPPVLIQHGSDDEIVPCSQADYLYDRVREVCGEGRAEKEIFRGWNHGGLDLRWYEPKNQTHTWEFLDRYLK